MLIINEKHEVLQVDQRIKSISKVQVYDLYWPKRANVSLCSLVRFLLYWCFTSSVAQV